MSPKESESPWERVCSVCIDTEARTQKKTDTRTHACTHTHTHTLNICVVVAVLPSGQAWRTGAGGAGGSGGVQHATGALRAPTAPWRGSPARESCLWGESSHAGVIQQRDCSPAAPCTQGYHPHIPTMVRGCNTWRTIKSPSEYCYFTMTSDLHCAE